MGASLIRGRVQIARVFRMPAGDYPRIHNLVKLLPQAATMDSSFEDFQELCRTVDAYYTSTRYPMVGEEPSESEVEEAMEAAASVVAAVRQRIANVSEKEPSS